MKRIVILGGGFGGVYTALELVKAVRRAQGELDVVLVSADDHFFFTPFLTEVVGGVIGLRHIAEPVRRLLEGTRIRFVRTRVTGIDLERRAVATEGAGEIGYDHLVVALGSVTSFFGLESVEKNALTLKSLPDALKARDQVLACFERAAALPAGDPQRRRLLCFTVAGGGPSGVELATDLYDLIHEALLAQFPEVRADETRVVLAEARDTILDRFDQRLIALAIERLRTKGIDLRLNHAIESYDGREIRFKDRPEAALPCETLVWTAGIKANPVVAALPVEKDRLGRVKVDETLRLPGRPEVFAIGDGAWGTDRDGQPFGPEGQVALQQAQATGRNLVRLLGGEPPAPFKFIRYGRLVALGTRWAVTEVFGIRLHGFLAWFVWRSVYLMKIHGLRNKLRVVIDWTIDLFFRGRDTMRLPAA